MTHPVIRELRQAAEHAPQAYRATRCNCGDRICQQWQILAISAECRFYNEEDARAVCDVLNLLAMEGDKR